MSNDAPPREREMPPIKAILVIAGAVCLFSGLVFLLDGWAGHEWHVSIYTALGVIALSLAPVSERLYARFTA
ncbi:MAG TPA: hypothetical protein VNZ52_02480 [Candidatus Thermoplasmatota archaeon]|nr:hypothetical protein [Candidatus Thermoplasmatota archaeon]